MAPSESAVAAHEAAVERFKYKLNAVASNFREAMQSLHAECLIRESLWEAGEAARAEALDKASGNPLFNDKSLSMYADYDHTRYTERMEAMAEAEGIVNSLSNLNSGVIGDMKGFFEKEKPVITALAGELESFRQLMENDGQEKRELARKGYYTLVDMVEMRASEREILDMPRETASKALMQIAADFDAYAAERRASLAEVQEKTSAAETEREPVKAVKCAMGASWFGAVPEAVSSLSAVVRHVLSQAFSFADRETLDSIANPAASRQDRQEKELEERGMAMSM